MGTHLVSISTQFGAQCYVAFVAGPTMFLNMPRHQFGDVQARLFPKFAMVGISTGVLALASYHIGHPGAFDLSWSLLAGSLTANLLNGFYLFPLTTKYQYELRAVDKQNEDKDKDEEAVKAAKMRFGIAHGICNLVNMGSQVANLAYLVMLAGKMGAVW